MQKASPFIEFMTENTTDWSLVLWIFTDMEDGSGIATSYGISINKDEDDGSFTSWIMSEIQNIEDYIKGHKTFDAALQYITQFIIKKMEKVVKKTRFGIIDFDYRPNNNIANIDKIIKERTIDLTVCDKELLNNLKRAATNLQSSIPKTSLVSKLYNEIQNAGNVYESLRSLDALLSWSHNIVSWDTYKSVF